MMSLRNDTNAHLFLLLASALRLASGATANISYGLIALYALRGQEQAIRALFLSWLFSYFNSGYAPVASFAAVGRYAVLLAAATSVICRMRGVANTREDRALVGLTVLCGGFIFVHSLLFSLAPEISVLKGVSWTLAMSTALAGWAGLKDDRREQLSQQLFVILTLVMLSSIVVLPLPASYLFGSFTGIIAHPQSLGVTLALLCAAATLQAITMPRPPWTLIAIIPLCMALIVLSRARTAALAILLGVAVALLFGPILFGFARRQWMPGLRSRSMQSALFLALVGVAAAWPRLAAESEAFLAKSTDSVTILQAYEASRGGLIEEMWMNIKTYPFQGIGFGVASVPELMVVIREPIFNLPVSALVEKGVMPIAVLEEMGMPGFLVFATWLWAVLSRSGHRGLLALAVVLVALFLNMGESILFSPSGMGMLVILSIAWAATGKQLKAGRPLC